MEATEASEDARRSISVDRSDARGIGVHHLAARAYGLSWGGSLLDSLYGGL